MAKKIRSKAGKRILKRIINSYILAQDDPMDKEKLRSLRLYLNQRGIERIRMKYLVKKIKEQKEKKKKKKRLREMETELFKKDEETKETKKYRYGSSFCPNCNMYKDYQKECPYCGKLELMR